MEKAGSTLHVHFEQDEIFYVTEGEFLFQVGDEQQLAGPGTLFFCRATCLILGYNAVKRAG